MSWEAIATFSGSAATLITGIAAVVAAYLVARRQTRIVERQTNIVERQTDLQALSFKHDVFDRRGVVYNAVDKYLSIIARRHRAPAFDEYEPYHVALNSARFLFSRHLWEQLKQLDTLADDLRERLEGSTMYTPVDPELQAGLDDLKKRLDGLPLLFEPEMSLSGNLKDQRNFMNPLRVNS